ncbi:hypothetical protein WICPIJ_002400 [Wickerhamomyces pijperi]|uniref:Glutamine amidotransferase type-2 domain-containing protein n=1 Tax=Wickerhamomyces pijperi TaxID=599730 RepID=A0A9P8TQ70_WICPI|nr:hypothetical protein WICPIJ_002400 [Wickerhamomyces pijperi]
MDKYILGQIKIYVCECMSRKICENFPRDLGTNFQDKKKNPKKIIRRHDDLRTDFISQILKPQDTLPLQMCGILFHYQQKQNDQTSTYISFDETEISSILKTSDDDSSISTFLQDKLNERSNLQITTQFQRLIPYILSRGPNYAQLIQTGNSTGSISQFSSVLSLRCPFTTQPFFDSRYSVQFNGELYNDDIEGNDTEYLLQKLQNSTDGDIADVIHDLDGEFAFVIVDNLLNRVYYGRDSQGKRSLVHCVSDGELYVSSLNPCEESESESESEDKFLNCLNGVIYQYDLTQNKPMPEIPNDKVYQVLDQLDGEMVHRATHLNEVDRLLRASVKKRISTIQPYHDPEQQQHKQHLFSILFSGGLDCTIIAAIAAEQMLSCASSDSVPIIDLLNVGFENPRTGLTPQEAPDRILAISSWRHLQMKYPQVRFQLIEIDVPYGEYLKGKQIVRKLMWPKNTEMDLSIAIAFYFASSGFGTMKCLSVGETGEEESKTEKYQSPCKVLLSGLGADELYGGYHKLNSRSLQQLVPELTTQINGIHDRNLNRDDKVISHNGVEVRYPYLDHSVIKYSTEKVEINYKVAKLILRDYAGEILDLQFVREEKKRAIQFGAKSARMVKDGSKKGQALIE